LDAEISPTVPEFLLSGWPETPTYLILDVGLPGPDALDFPQKLAAANICVPIIFVTRCGDIGKSVRAMKNGAVDFLSKPFRDQDLVDSIQLALAKDRAWCARQREMATLAARFEILTQRERQVVAQVVKGRLNKQSRRRARHERDHGQGAPGKVMRKMKATSFRISPGWRTRSVSTRSSRHDRYVIAPTEPTQPWHRLPRHGPLAEMAPNPLTIRQIQASSRTNT
jgi:FixJ family two-component response regulator